MKKKSKNPVNALASNLVGDKTARRMKQGDVDDLIKAVTVKGNSLRMIKR